MGKCTSKQTYAVEPVVGFQQRVTMGKHGEESLSLEVNEENGVVVVGGGVATEGATTITNYIDEYDAHVVHIDRFESLYTIKKLLGSGSFAKVYLGVNRRTHEQVAIKVLNKRVDESEIHYFRIECRIMLRVRDHANVCTIKRIYETEDFIYVVMDYCEEGNLLDVALKHGTRSEEEAAQVARDIASALAHTHKLGIAHRDVKLENILCDTDGNYLLADFGLAKEFVEVDRQTNHEVRRMLKSACGSPLYVSPEIVAHRPYTTSVDMWSLGVSLYSIISGTNPFYSENLTNPQLYSRIADGCYSFQGHRWANVSRGTKKFLCQLLCVNPNKRLTAQQVLSHPWVTSGGKWNGAPARHRLRTLQQSSDDTTSSQTPTDTPISIVNRLQSHSEDHRIQPSRSYDERVQTSSFKQRRPNGSRKNGGGRSTPQELRRYRTHYQ